MSDTQTLANIYRPQCFADVVGQTTAVSVLKRIASAEGIAARAVFMKGAFGSGKCVGGDTRISTVHGYRRIKDILPTAGEGFTEFVEGVEQVDGTYASTSHYYKESCVLLNTYRCHSGRVFSGTAAHRVWAYRMGSNVVELVPCKLLRTGDYIASRALDQLGSWDFSLDVTAYKQGYTYRRWCWRKPGYVGDELCVDEAAYASRDIAMSYLCGLLDVAGNFQYGVISFSSTHYNYVEGVRELLDYIGLDYNSVFGRRVRVQDKHKGSESKGVDHVRLTLESSIFFYKMYSRWVAAHSDEVLAIRQDCRDIRRILKVSRSLDCIAPGSYQVAGINIGAGTVYRQLLSELKIALKGLSLKILSQQVSGFISWYRSFKGGILRPCILEELDRILLASGRVEGIGAMLRSFCGVRFDKIISISTAVRVVYDVTVPGSHVFMSGNFLNHNTTMARIFAKAMNCSAFKKVGDVCNECTGCAEAQSVNSTLYWELDGTVVGNVEGIRQLTERLSYVPEGRRVVVLDEVQAISAAASAALLKVVEEGVPNTMFLFCGTEGISAPLQSRCVNVSIELLPLSVIEDYIGRIAASRGILLSEDELHILSAKSGGHMRDALSLLQFYEMVGSKALDSSYHTLVEFILGCFARSSGIVAAERLTALLLYPSDDIKRSIGLLLRNIFTAVEGDSPEYRLQKAGLGKSLFQFFYAPVAQSALGDEVGIEILLRALMDKAGVR